MTKNRMIQSLTIIIILAALLWGFALMANAFSLAAHPLG
jgi:hypothetical protein